MHQHTCMYPAVQLFCCETFLLLRNITCSYRSYQNNYIYIPRLLISGGSCPPLSPHIPIPPEQTGFTSWDTDQIALSILNGCSFHPASWLANRNVSSCLTTTQWKLLILKICRHALHLQGRRQNKKSWPNYPSSFTVLRYATTILLLIINTPSAEQWNGAVSCFIEWVWI